MKTLTFFYLSLFITMYIYADSNILYFGIAKDGTGLVHPHDTIIISSDNTTKYNIDISDYKRDTLNFIEFEALRENALLYIDSIMVFNDKDTLLVDGFEEYDTITDVMDPIITNDKEWGVFVPTGSVIKMSIVYRKKGKCFKVWYKTYMGVYFWLKFNAFQDYSKYHTLQLSISRNQHPDSTAIIKKGESLNKNADIIQIGANNTILYKVAPGNHKTVLELYTISGRKVKTLVNGYKQAGEYSLSLKEQNVVPGLYYVRALLGEKNVTQKVAIVK